MKHSPVQNYICPGLKSSLIGNRAEDGSCVRMFEAERDTREHWITPHDHAYDFTCIVLRGTVENTIYVPPGQIYVNEDGTKDGKGLYVVGHLERHLEIGDYRVHREPTMPQEFGTYTATYRRGQTYSMNHDEIHSIRFYAGTSVLFLEGRHIRSTTVFLEPWVDGFGRVETFKCEPWMFRK